MPRETGRKVIAQNKRARHDYHVDDSIEAGLVLQGTEVKSLREGRASLVHDVSEGGLAVALAEAALWSGVGAVLSLGDDQLALFGEIGGQVVAALPAEHVEPDPQDGGVEVRLIGTVGGDDLLGIPLDELRAAHEGGGR